jgi:helicase MOV-10
MGQALLSEWKAHREYVRDCVLFQVPGTLDVTTDLWSLQIPPRFCRNMRIGERVSVRCLENELWLYVGFVHKIGIDSIQVSFSGLSFTTTRTFPLLRFHLDARPYHFMGMALTKAARFAWLWDYPEKRFELIHGPAYSGKTKALAQEANKILENPTSRILVLAPTESSADRITLRIVQDLKPETATNVLLRLPEWDYAPRAVHPDVLRFTVRDINGHFTVHTSHTRRVWVMTPGVSRIFERLPQHLVQFTHILVDDSTRMTEPELLVPLTMSCAQQASRIVLSGDLSQPGPQLYARHIRHPQLRLRSLFERLWTKCPSVLRREYTVSYYTPPVLLEIASANLGESSGKVDKCAEYTSAFDNDYHRLRYPEIYVLEPDAPLVVYGINGLVEHQTNRQEVELIQTLVRQWASQRILLLSAHDAQTDLLRETCSSSPTVCVGSIETLYDTEPDIVIVSLVDDSENEFLRSPRAFYALLTRTRGLLVVVGSPTVLQMVPYWRRLSAYAHRTHKYRGPLMDGVSFPEEPTHYEYERSLIPDGILNDDAVYV